MVKLIAGKNLWSELVHSTRKLAQESMLFAFGMPDDWRAVALILSLVCSGAGASRPVLHESWTGTPDGLPAVGLVGIVFLVSLRR